MATPITDKATKPPMTPPAIAPACDGFRPLSVTVLIGPVMIDDGEREIVEELGSETVEGTGAKRSGRPPAAFAATGSNLSPT